jgi:hypothetical protein
VFNRTLVESASMADANTSLVGFTSSVVEATTAAESFSSTADFAVEINEAATAFAANNASMDFVSSIVETAIVADVAPETGFDFSLTVAETAQAADALIPQGIYNFLMAEAASMSSALAPTRDMTVAVSEQARVDAENTVAASLFSAKIGESVMVSDPLSARFLWEEVDDSETTDWVLVDDSQTVVWTPVATALP